MRLLLQLVRRLATKPGLRRLTEVDAFMRISFSLRASLVRQPWRFVWNELRPGTSVAATYPLRESGVAITIRHKSHDVLILDEVFSQREYTFPEAVVSRLSGRAGRSPKVADLGANIGLFGAWILGRFPEAEIVAFEPDPGNAELHRTTIEKNGRGQTWQLLEASAMTRSGTVRFSAGAFALSHVAALDEEGIEVRGVDVFPLIADADLLKIDIEGAEWPILQDPRFQELGATAVVLEYHPEGAPGPEPARAAEALLGEAGFTVAAHHRKDTGAGVLWALSASP